VIKLILDPNPDADQSRNLTISFAAQGSVTFFTIPRAQTDTQRQTHITYLPTSLADVINYRVTVNYFSCPRIGLVLVSRDDAHLEVGS